jgi:hypothetical protein
MARTPEVMKAFAEALKAMAEVLRKIKNDRAK